MISDQIYLIYSSADEMFNLVSNKQMRNTANLFSCKVYHSCKSDKVPFIKRVDVSQADSFLDKENIINIGSVCTDMNAYNNHTRHTKPVCVHLTEPE